MPLKVRAGAGAGAGAGAPSKEGSDHPVEYFHHPDDAEDNEPFPEVRGVEEKEEEVEDIVEVGEVEDEEVAAPPDEAHAADDHEGEDEDEGQAGGVGRAWQGAE